jgi:hypothetical protein
MLFGFKGTLSIVGFETFWKILNHILQSFLNKKIVPNLIEDQIINYIYITQN